MKKRILLVNPKVYSSDIVYFPLGLGYLAGACQAHGIEVKCLDCALTPMTPKKIAEFASHGGFHIVGVGGFLPQLKFSLEIADEIKATSKDTIVILGGTQTIGTEDFILNHSRTDVVFRGEAEEGLVRFIDLLYEDRDYTALEAISYRYNNRIFHNPGMGIVRDLDALPLPAFEAFDIEKYTINNYHSIPGRKTIDMICSRGCPFRCSYCTNSKKRLPARYRSAKSITSEIRLLKRRYGIEDFSFGDEIFTINKAKSMRICEAIGDEKVSWVTSCRADGLDHELLSAMKRSGCRMIFIGFESGSDAILSAMNKKASRCRYEETIRMLHQAKMPFYANFMIGMPEETPQTIRETLDFCVANGLIFASAYVTPFPGTELYDQVQEKLPDEKEYFDQLSEMSFAKEPVVNLTSMATETLVALRNKTVVQTISARIQNRMKWMPSFIAILICSVYLKIFNVKHPVAAKLTRPLNKIIYRFFQG